MMWFFIKANNSVFHLFIKRNNISSTICQINIDTINDAGTFLRYLLVTVEYEEQIMTFHDLKRGLKTHFLRVKSTKLVILFLRYDTVPVFYRHLIK